MSVVGRDPAVAPAAMGDCYRSEAMKSCLSRAFVRSCLSGGKIPSFCFPQQCVTKQTRSNSVNTKPARPVPWNKGRLTGQKPPLKFREIWSGRTQLRMAEIARDLALFNLAIDSKLHRCDPVALRAGDVVHGEHQDIFPFEHLPGSIHGGHLRSARRAPGRPEVDELVEGARRSTMGELAEHTLVADRVLVF